MKSTRRLEDAQALLTQKRYAEAVRVYENRANQGDTHSQVFLGWMYFEGQGVAKNVDKALGWFNRAASLGSKEGAFYAGRTAMSLNQYEKAIESFQAAARQEYGPALLWLGLIYTRGLGVKEDLGKGVDYLKRAEKLKNRFAQRELALLMLKGRLGISKIPFGLALLPFAILAGMFSVIVNGPNDELTG